MAQAIAPAIQPFLRRGLAARLQAGVSPVDLGLERFQEPVFNPQTQLFEDQFRSDVFVPRTEGESRIDVNILPRDVTPGIQAGGPGANVQAGLPGGQPLDLFSGFTPTDPSSFPQLESPDVDSSVGGGSLALGLGGPLGAVALKKFLASDTGQDLTERISQLFGGSDPSLAGLPESFLAAPTAAPTQGVAAPIGTIGEETIGPFDSLLEGLGAGHPLFDPVSLAGLPEAFLAAPTAAPTQGIAAPIGAIGVEDIGPTATTLGGTTTTSSPISGQGNLPGGSSTLGNIASGLASAGIGAGVGFGVGQLPGIEGSPAQLAASNLIGGSAALAASTALASSGIGTGVGALGAGLFAGAGVLGVLAAPILDHFQKAPDERKIDGDAFATAVSPLFEHIGLNWQTPNFGGGGKRLDDLQSLPPELQPYAGGLEAVRIGVVNTPTQSPWLNKLAVQNNLVNNNATPAQTAFVLQGLLGPDIQTATDKLTNFLDTDTGVNKTNNINRHKLGKAAGSSGLFKNTDTFLNSDLMAESAELHVQALEGLEAIYGQPLENKDQLIQQVRDSYANEVTFRQAKEVAEILYDQVSNSSKYDVGDAEEVLSKITGIDAEHIKQNDQFINEHRSELAKFFNIRSGLLRKALDD